jgi:PPOX class probable F420-dependent enzyme
LENNNLIQFLNHRYINLESYKKNGKAVRTPVWFVEDKGVIYVRTDQNSGKMKRMRNNNHILIVPSDFRGKPKGSWIKAEINIASTNEKERANKLLDQKYGLQAKILKLIYKIKRIKPTIVSIYIVK